MRRAIRSQRPGLNVKRWVFSKDQNLPGLVSYEIYEILSV
jgi:hypothetical protein